jgi:hypothetical protein
MPAPKKPFRIRIELQWQGAQLDDVGLHLLQRLLDAFEPSGGLRATNSDFTATFGQAWPGTPMEDPRRVEVLRQLLQCIGMLRAFRSRWEAYGQEDTTDDVAERLHKNPSWSFYGPPPPVAPLD